MTILRPSADIITTGWNSFRPSMGMRRSGWTRQPQVTVEVNSDFGNTFSVNFATVKESITGGKVLVATQLGISLDCNGSNYATFPNKSFNSTSHGLTIVFSAYRKTSGDGVFLGDISSSSYFLSLDVNSVVYRASTQVDFGGISSALTQSPATYVLRIGSGSSSVKTLYRNGVVIGLTGNTTSGSGEFVVNALGAGYSGANYSLSGYIAGMSVIPFDVGHSLCLGLSQNPWQIFKPRYNLIGV